MIKKILKFLGVLLMVLVIIFLCGPREKVPTLDSSISVLTVDLTDIEQYVTEKEAAISTIKPNNQAQILWADSVPKKTDYSFVYLHGFSASHGEGEPIHRHLAERYGANLYLSRLSQHGLEGKESYLNLEVEEWMESAKEAIAIGQVLGEKVILLTCSTGSTMGLFLAADNPNIEGIVCYSPNIDLFNPSSDMLLYPWGLQIMRATMGSDYRGFEATEDMQKFWQHEYRIEGLLKLKALVNATMKEEVFKRITQPVFMGYYYKNEEEQDKAVSVKRMLEMYGQLGTVDSLKRKVAFDKVGGHVISSVYQSEDVESVEKATVVFLEEVMGLVSLEN